MTRYYGGTARARDSHTRNSVKVGGGERKAGMSRIVESTPELYRAFHVHAIPKAWVHWNPDVTHMLHSRAMNPYRQNTSWTSALAHKVRVHDT